MTDKDWVLEYYPDAKIIITSFKAIYFYQVVISKLNLFSGLHLTENNAWTRIKSKIDAQRIIMTDLQQKIEDAKKNARQILEQKTKDYLEAQRIINEELLAECKKIADKIPEQVEKCILAHQTIIKIYNVLPTEYKTNSINNVKLIGFADYLFKYLKEQGLNVFVKTEYQRASCCYEDSYWDVYIGLKV